MVEFEPIKRKPGELIRSEDWNKMQEDIRGNLKELESKLHDLKDYIDNMQETTTLLNINSLIGSTYNLNEVVPSETANPYIEYLLSPNEYVWYRYRIANPNPEKEVLTIIFRNINGECTPRIGNVLHYRAKITPATE